MGRFLAQRDYAGAAALQALMETGVSTSSDCAPAPHRVASALPHESRAGAEERSALEPGIAESDRDGRTDDARACGTTARFHELKNLFKPDAILHSRVNLECVRLLSSGPTSTMRDPKGKGKGKGK